MALEGNWFYPTSIRFGVGRVRELAQACRALSMKRPLLVTDRGLMSSSLIDSAVRQLGKQGLSVEVFGDVDPNPSDTNLTAGLEMFAQGSHDGIIGFGGGSSLDLAKMIALMTQQTRPVWDFEDVDDWWTRADPNVIAPIIAIPTTAGTGSEVGRSSLLTRSSTREKRVIFHPKLLPSIVISDPDLTISLPPPLTAGTGMDAFAHCLEAFCSPHFHPMAEAMALEGMRIVKDHLPQAYRHGHDREARSQMMAAAMMGGASFQKGLGAVHAISHAIGALHGVHHGTANAILIPPILEFNRSAIESKIHTATHHLNIQQGLEGMVTFVCQMNEQLGIPKNLADLGVTNPDLDRILTKTLQDPSCAGNPIRLTKENLRPLLAQLFPQA